MIKCVRGVFLNNGSLLVEVVDFGNSRESVHENSHEEDGALRVEANSCIGGVVEDRTDNQGHDEVGGDTGCCGRQVVPDALVSSFGGELDLSCQADDVRRLGADVFCLSVKLLVES